MAFDSLVFFLFHVTDFEIQSSHLGLKLIDVDVRLQFDAFLLLFDAIQFVFLSLFQVENLFVL